jgi:hypothetical protein
MSLIELSQLKLKSQRVEAKRALTTLFVWDEKPGGLPESLKGQAREAVIAVLIYLMDLSHRQSWDFEDCLQQALDNSWQKP